MADVDYSERIKQLDATLASIEQVLDLDSMRAEVAELGEQVAAPDLWDDQANAQRVTGRLSVLQAELERVTGLRSRLDDAEIMVELAREESDAASLAEADTELDRLAKSIEALEVRTLLSGEYDERDAVDLDPLRRRWRRRRRLGRDADADVPALGRAAQVPAPRSTRRRTPRRPASSRPPSPSRRPTPTAR